MNAANGSQLRPFLREHLDERLELALPIVWHPGEPYVQF
jgi:hypothetical protein